MGIKTQTFSCKIDDLSDTSDVVKGFDISNNTLYPTKIDEVIEMFIESVKEDKGEIGQIIPFVSNDDITVVILYNDEPSTLSGQGLQVPR